MSAIYANLGRALSETGVNGSQLNEILSAALRASCGGCNIQLTSHEVEQVALVENPTQLTHAKLKRLRLGYCAREGCEATDYRIQLEPYPGVDWDIIGAMANDLMLAQKAATEAEARHRTRRLQNQRTKRTLVGMMIVVFAVLLFFFWRQGRPSFAKKPQKYKLDPASVSSSPEQ